MSKNDRSCIICGNPAKSGEHVFPAALGGRRTSNGIYCKKHNEGFGPLVAHLQQDLALMNALLEIRPDREDESKPYVFESDGERHSLVGEKVDVAPPDPRDVNNVPEIGVPTKMKFKSEAQAQAWFQEMKRHGVEISIAERHGVNTEYRIRPYHLQLRFGGHEVLQAVCYLALTFFAQYFHREARQDSLKGIKDLLLTPVNSEETWVHDFVWWEGKPPQEVLNANPYRFGHTVVVGVSPVTNKVHAFISFFSCLNFKIFLGEVECSSENRSVTVFIDPEAERAPHDITELKQVELPSGVERHEVELGDMLSRGIADSAMRSFFQRVQEHRDELLEASLKAELERLIELSDEHALPFLVELVKSHSGRVLRLMHEVASGIEKAVQGNTSDEAEAERFIEFIRLFVTEDPESLNGLNAQTTTVLECSCFVLALELVQEHTEGKLTAQSAVDLLQGGRGVHLIWTKVFQQLISGA